MIRQTPPSALTVAFVRLGDVEPARTLAKDTLQRCRRVLGPNHRVTLYLTQVASTGDLMLDGDAAADRASRPE